jgi:hypothetical protein
VRPMPCLSKRLEKEEPSQSQTECDQDQSAEPSLDILLYGSSRHDLKSSNGQFVRQFPLCG